MDKRSAQIATICECIDQCFAFALWCDDFAQHVDPDDMVMGLDRAFELVSDSTRLLSFLALRKLDDFLGGVKAKPDDLTAAALNIDVAKVLGDVGDRFLSVEERETINKGVAHLTEKLSLDRDSEGDLEAILQRSIPVLERLVAELRNADTAKEAEQWLAQTEKLIKGARQLAEEKKAQAEQK